MPSCPREGRLAPSRDRCQDSDSLSWTGLHGAPGVDWAEQPSLEKDHQTLPSEPPWLGNPYHTFLEGKLWPT